MSLLRSPSGDPAPLAKIARIESSTEILANLSRNSRGEIAGSTLSEWDEAYRRVEAYFSALQIDNKLLLNALVLKVLGKVSEDFKDTPQRLPVELAAEETERQLAQWFRRAFAGTQTDSEDQISIRGRLALLLAQSDLEWQEYFLNDSPLPEPLVTALQGADLPSDPKFCFVEMRPRPLDLGIVAWIHRGLESMGAWRVLVPWIFWIAFLSMFFYFIR